MTTDSPANYFLHQALTKCSGKPNYKKLKIIYDELKANARSVPSDLGGGAQGLLGLVMTAARYILIPGTVAFVRPPNPGPLVIPAGTTQHETARLRYEHGENIRKYREVVQCETLLKNMIVEAIEPKYLKAFKNRDTGAIEIPIHTLIERLFSRYGKVTATDVDKAELEVKKHPYHLSDPITDVFEAVDDLVHLAEKANCPYTDAQKLKFGMTIIRNTHDFEEAQKAWHAKPDADKTWANFKTHFEDEHDTLLEIRGLDMNNTAYHQAHSIAQTIVENNNKTFLQDMKDIEASVLEAIEAKNSEDDTYSTHSMNSDSLSSVTCSLKSENSEMMKTMLSMQDEIKSLKAELKNSNNRRGRDPNVDYSIPFWERPGSTHKYCHSCGPNKTHWGRNVKTKNLDIKMMQHGASGWVATHAASLRDSCEGVGKRLLILLIVTLFSVLK